MSKTKIMYMDFLDEQLIRNSFLIFLALAIKIDS